MHMFIKAEAGIGSPGPRLTGGWELWVLGTKLKPSARKRSVLTAEHSLQPLPHPSHCLPTGFDLQ